MDLTNGQVKLYDVVRRHERAGGEWMEKRTELIEAREEKGWTQAELAAEVGIDNTYLSHIEAGRKTPPAEIMGRLAAKLEKPVIKLFRKELAPTG